ncbi:MAG: ATP synthase F1 subunit delta [Saprospiraceae bacterium]|nr:ATP synthase F1 subunit delta [Saprospiraceae bacterium]
MSAFRIASRYAKSLIDLAVDENKLERVMEDIQYFLEASQVRDLRLLLRSPIVNAHKKGQILNRLFRDKFDVLTMSFLDIILRKGREPMLVEIAESFVEQYREIREISAVRVITAVPLTGEQVEEIKDRIRASGVTYPNIELETHVDPAIMGGLILEFQDKLYDASVARQLEELRKEFANGNPEHAN